MTRRTLLIILGALAVVAIILASWYWLFSRGTPQQQLFGGSGTKTGTTTATTGQQTNIPTNTGSNTSTGGTNIPLNGVNGPGNTGSNVGSSTVVFGTATGVGQVPGVEWLGNGSGSGGGGASTSFVPSGVNDLASGAGGGSVVINGTGGAGGSNGSGLGSAAAILGATAAGCAVIFSNNVPAIGESAGAGVAATLAGGFVLTYDFNAYKQRSQNQYKDVQDCIARTIAKVALQQMTNSIVTWINSGFNGKPSFVQNFQAYFSNVADVAAGEFIKGTSLSFLCSPFQLQVKLAIAQSYARRNGAGGSCSLTGIEKNINGFLNGNNAPTGWASLLALTSVPTNNPFGAYAYAQIGLATAQNNALNEANRGISPGGFLSLKKCNPPDSKNPADCKVVTPGDSIQSVLANQLNLSPDLLKSAGVSGSFDAIFNALLTQLTTRALQNGITSLNAQNGYAGNFLTPDQQQAQTKGNDLLITLQNMSSVAQQYGQTEQGSIDDIQNAQQQLSTLSNCWESTGKSTQASTTQNSITLLEIQVGQYNNNITRANAGISALQQLQSQVLSITTSAEEAKAEQNYQSALASGVLITQADLTSAQQDRTTLQSQLTARNSQTASDLAQCQAASAQAPQSL